MVCLKAPAMSWSFIAVIALLIAGCGGGGRSSTPPSPPPVSNPVPSVSSISPPLALAGSKALTLTVTGSSFIVGSEIRWNGAARTTTYLGGSQLRTTIGPEDLANAGPIALTVFNPTPGGGMSNTSTFTIVSVLPVSLSTILLPDAYNTKPYDYELQAEGGIPPYTWTIAGGALPDGLSMSAGGAISGTAPDADSTSDFLVQISDNASAPNTLTQPLSIKVRTGRMGRNDSCDTATTISNGTIRASISPYADIDVYSFQGTVGKAVEIETYAQRLDAGIYLDTLLELLDASCLQLSNNDDFGSNSLDSFISYGPLPYSGTYYIRVTDVRGDGRPDFPYELHLSGAE